VKGFVRGFKPALNDMDWFDWFWLSFLVFASVLFWVVIDELWEAFNL
jgi:hypothetical protein